MSERVLVPLLVLSCVTAVTSAQQARVQIIPCPGETASVIVRDLQGQPTSSEFQRSRVAVEYCITNTASDPTATSVISNLRVTLNQQTLVTSPGGLTIAPDDVFFIRQLVDLTVQPSVSVLAMTVEYDATNDTFSFDDTATTGLRVRAAPVGVPNLQALGLFAVETGDQSTSRTVFDTTESIALLGFWNNTGFASTSTGYPVIVRRVGSSPFEQETRPPLAAGQIDDFTSAPILGQLPKGFYEYELAVDTGFNGDSFIAEFDESDNTLTLEIRVVGATAEEVLEFDNRPGLTFFDTLEFLAVFDSQDRNADVNVDNVVSQQDVEFYVNLFGIVSP